MRIRPVRQVRFERRLAMGISMRPLTTFAESGLPIHRGVHSLIGHWPQPLPWLRFFLRIRSSALWSGRSSGFPSA